MTFAVNSNGLYSLEVEAESEADAKDKYETVRGLVKGINPITVTLVGEPVVTKGPSPFGLMVSDRYEPYVKTPEPTKAVEVKKAFPDLVPKSEAAKVDLAGEEVLVSK